MLIYRHEEKYKNGPENNFLVLVRYAPKKEVTAVLSLLFPPGHFFAVDMAFNMTVPAFDSCSFVLTLNENKNIPREYNVSIASQFLQLI